MFQFVDFRNIIVLISLAIHTLLLWFMYRYGRKTLSGKAYAGAILAIVGWVVPLVFYRSDSWGLGLVWARLLYCMAVFTSVTFLYFALVFPENKHPTRWMNIVLGLESICIALVCLLSSLVIKNIQTVVEGENHIIFGPLYMLYVLHIALPFLIGFIILLLKLRRHAGIERRQILSILIGYFFAANLAMATNLILPWLGYFELNWLGQLFSTIVAAFTTYAILRYKLLNIKIIITEALVLLIIFFIFIQWLFSATGIRFLANSIILAAVIAISSLLLRSITKETQRREELQLANLRLQELDHQKNEFLSIAAHQLRTPLSILNGYIELIKDEAFGNKETEESKQALQNMDESNTRLTSLVNEFLDIARIEAGRTEFRFTNADLTATITSVVNELTSRASEKKLRLLWNPAGSLVGRLDTDKIRHVILNFVDNAIKYSNHGTITVTAAAEENGLAFRVTDQGIGFEESDRVNLFQKLFRGKNVEGTNVNGTGIGLYVCSKFIEAHDGRVWAKSPGLGRGSEFGFWIPLQGTERVY